MVHNAHPNIFITLFDVLITCIRQLAAELGSTDTGQRNSLKARALLVIILSLWLWYRDSLGTQKVNLPPLEAGTRGLVKRQNTERTQCVYSELQSITGSVK
jgi:hypothetical protein